MEVGGESGAGAEYLFAWIVDHWGPAAKGIVLQVSGNL